MNLSKLKKGRVFRQLAEIWMAGFCFFTFTILIRIHFFGIILGMTLFDTYFLDRKGFFKNLIINAIIYFSYDFICQLIYTHYEVKLADAFTYMLYHVLLSYFLFNMILKVRRDETDYI